MIKFFILILLVSMICNKDNGSISSKSEQQIKQSISVSSSYQKHKLIASAYLVYENGDLSSFDILNDKTIVLWNTIIGSGDAIKPSTKTRLNLLGSIDSLNTKIFNGSKLVIDTIFNLNKVFNYEIKNTGCEKISITILKNKNVLYSGVIPFHCGE